MKMTPEIEAAMKRAGLDPASLRAKRGKKQEESVLLPTFPIKRGKNPPRSPFDPARKIGAPFSCEDCGKVGLRTGAMQKVCEPCSQARSDARRKRWIEKNPDADREAKRKYGLGIRSKVVAAGVQVNQGERWGVESVFPDETGMKWVRRVAFPYTKAFSKNHIYTYNRLGHVALRKETMQARDALTAALNLAIADVKVVTNKVWMAIVVQKPNHKSDAINVIDSVADAVKVSLGVDDRWFSIRQLDWQIVKYEPQIFIGVGQESDIDLQICSHCGRSLPYEMFWKNANAKEGIGRGCKDCMRFKGKRFAEPKQEA